MIHIHWHVNDVSGDLFSILHINAGSITHQLDDIDILLNTVPLKISVLAISETWLNAETAKLVKLNNYKFEFNNR